VRFGARAAVFIFGGEVRYWAATLTAVVVNADYYLGSCGCRRLSLELAAREEGAGGWRGLRQQRQPKATGGG